MKIEFKEKNHNSGAEGSLEHCVCTWPISKWFSHWLPGQWDQCRGKVHRQVHHNIHYHSHQHLLHRYHRYYHLNINRQSPSPIGSTTIEWGSNRSTGHKVYPYTWFCIIFFKGIFGSIFGRFFDWFLVVL